ncbi:MAG: hypothetical protein AB7K09_07695 [Planctomycetota bacterium]
MNSLLAATMCGGEVVSGGLACCWPAGDGVVWVTEARAMIQVQTDGGTVVVAAGDLLAGGRTAAGGIDHDVAGDDVLILEWFERWGAPTGSKLPVRHLLFMRMREGRTAGALHVGHGRLERFDTVPAAMFEQLDSSDARLLPAGERPAFRQRPRGTVLQAIVLPGARRFRWQQSRRVSRQCCRRFQCPAFAWPLHEAVWQAADVNHAPIVDDGPLYDALRSRVVDGIYHPASEPQAHPDAPAPLALFGAPGVNGHTGGADAC